MVGCEEMKRKHRKAKILLVIMWNEEKREEDDNNNDDETEWGKERYVNCDGDIFYMNKFS